MTVGASPTREQAIGLVHEWIQNANLRKHCYAVEAAMRAYARKFGEDEERWGLTGLIHDFDWERHPDRERHPVAGVEVLRAKGWPEDVCRAVNLGYRDPATINPADFAGREAEGILLVPHAGEILYRPKPGVPTKDQFSEDLKPLQDACRWTDGYWDFGPGMQRKWNEIQNTHRDIQILANYLLVQYKARVWSKPSVASESG